MTNREINIIRLFMSGDYLSLDAISIQLNISKRTVSRSISSIREKLMGLLDK